MPFILLVLVAFAWIGCNSDQPFAPAEQEAISAAKPVGIGAVMSVQNRHTPDLLAISGVVGTATGQGADGKPVVLVLTKRPGVAGIPRNLDGVSVVVKVTGEIQALQTGAPDPTDRFIRPVPIGVSTGHPDITAGTIGCRVTDGTNVYALSNNHVYANANNASVGDNVLQPGAYDGGQNPGDAIGTLSDFEPISFRRRDKNKMDAAIALSTTGNLGTGTPSGGYGIPGTEPVGAVVGQSVRKFGRTTGLTKGQVTGVNATVNVGYGPGQTAKFVGQIIVEPGGFSAGGDSGSLIVTDNAGSNPVGLLFAGSSTITIANQIDLVLDRFGVTIEGETGTPNDPPTVSITSPADGSTFSSGASVSFAGSADDTEDKDVTSSLVWTSDLSGEIGAGGSFSATLGDGIHTITAQATDSGDKTGSASISITVGTPPPTPTLFVAISFDKNPPDYYVNRERVQITVTVTDGTNPVSGAAVHVEIVTPNGKFLLAGDTTTDGAGKATLTHKINSKRDGMGTNDVNATASKAGYISGSGSAEFVTQ